MAVYFPFSEAQVAACGAVGCAVRACPRLWGGAGAQPQALKPPWGMSLGMSTRWTGICCRGLCPFQAAWQSSCCCLCFLCFLSHACVLKAVKYSWPCRELRGGSGGAGKQNQGCEGKSPVLLYLPFHAWLQTHEQQLESSVAVSPLG